MKTFKLLSFEIVTDDKIQHFPLVDGIIINQENSHQSWVLELFISQKYRAVFDELLEQQSLINVRTVISFPDNEPAPFQVAVYAVHEIGENLSVLLKGKLKKIRVKYAEQLLSELLAEGIDREDLLARFAQDMKVRPQLKGN